MAEHRTESITNNHVIAVIDGDLAARAAADELRSKGFVHTDLFQGEEMARQVDLKGEAAGPLGKLLKAVVDRLSEEPNYLAQYQEEARDGHTVLAVAVDSREQAHEVKPILGRHGARNLRFFTRLAVTDLSPETNPSARSQESPERRSNM